MGAVFITWSFGLDARWRTKRVFETLDDLELALQEWICRYNTDRPHQGYRNKGKPPYAIVQNHLAAQQEA